MTPYPAGRKDLPLHAALERLARLRQLLQENGLDGIVVSGPENRRYLSGFTGSHGALVVGADTADLVTDFRYLTQAAAEAPGFRLVRQADDLWRTVGETVRDLKWTRAGFEAEHLTVAEHRRLTEASAGVVWESGPDLVAGLRQVKEPAEIELIRQAVRLADRVWAEILPGIRIGETEREVALRLETAMRQEGAEGAAFQTIVASGPRGALPHGLAGERRLAAGDLVVVDFGCVWRGYCSDMTRTVVLGRADGRQREIYDLVLRAQEAALRGLRPGMTGRQADDLARKVIAAAGYGEYFGHGLGHGLGLAVHESPRLSPTEETVLAPGMVLTVEPGIYLPDWGGVRIEDVVVVTENGCDVLTASDKRLTEIA